MPNILRRLIQSNWMKRRQLNVFMWNNDSRITRRKNLYMAELMEQRHLLSADVAPLAMDEYLRSQLDNAEVVEQLIENGLIDKAANGDIDLQLIREQGELPSVEPAESAAADSTVTPTLQSPDAKEQALVAAQKIRYLQDLQGDQVVVVDPAVDDYEVVLASFIGDQAYSIDWQEQQYGQATVQLFTITTQVSPIEEADDSLDWLGTTQLEEWQTITLVVLDKQQDGVEQISNLLGDYSDIAALHILSHGETGVVQLGNVQLNHQNLERYRRELEAWGKALTANGDVLLYGCNVADGTLGINFVDRLAGITEADIAASNNLTGNAFIGGDWALEHESGIIELSSEDFFAANEPRYEGILQLATYKVLGTTANKVNVIDPNDATLTVEKNIKDLTVNDTVKLKASDAIIDLSGIANAVVVLQEINNQLQLNVTSTSTNFVMVFNAGKELAGLLVNGDANLTLKSRLDKLTVKGDANHAVALGKKAGLISGTSPSDAVDYISGVTNAKGVPATLLNGHQVSVMLQGGSLGTIAAGHADKQLSLLFTKGGQFTSLELAQNADLGVHFLDGIKGQFRQLSTAPIKYNILAEGTQAITTAFVMSANSELKYFYADKGNNTIDVNAKSGSATTIETGAGADTLLSNKSDDTFIGGKGNDSYQFKAGWGTDKVTELQPGGSADGLDFTAVNKALRVEIKPSELASGAAGAGIVISDPVMDADGAITTAAQNTLTAHFTEIISTDESQAHRYIIHDLWAYQKKGSLLGSTSTVTINKPSGNATVAENATLDLSNITADLTITFEGNGVISVTAEDSVNKNTYVLDVWGIKDLIAGQGKNTFVFNSVQALTGTLKSSGASTAEHHFDYSKLGDSTALNIEVLTGSLKYATGLNYNSLLTKESKAFDLSVFGTKVDVADIKQIAKDQLTNNVLAQLTAVDLAIDTSITLAADTQTKSDTLKNAYDALDSSDQRLATENAIKSMQGFSQSAHEQAEQAKKINKALKETIDRVNTAIDSDNFVLAVNELKSAQVYFIQLEDLLLNTVSKAQAAKALFGANSAETIAEIDTKLTGTPANDYNVALTGLINDIETAVTGVKAKLAIAKTHTVDAEAPLDDAKLSEEKATTLQVAYDGRVIEINDVSLPTDDATAITFANKVQQTLNANINDLLVSAHYDHATKLLTIESQTFEDDDFNGKLTLSIYEYSASSYSSSALTVSATQVLDYDAEHQTHDVSINSLINAKGEMLIKSASADSHYAIGSNLQGANLQQGLFIKSITGLKTGSGFNFAGASSQIGTTVDLASSVANLTYKGADVDTTITLGSGNDLLAGGTGNDELAAGRGTDTYIFEDNWGHDLVIEKGPEDVGYSHYLLDTKDNDQANKASGSLGDQLDYSHVSEAMVHVVSGNNYLGVTGADQLATAQASLTGSARSDGKLLSDVDWTAADAAARVTAAALVADGSNSVMIKDQQFQFIDHIAASEGANSFYFGDQWGPSPDKTSSGIEALANTLGSGLGKLANRDRTLVIDTSNVGDNALVIDFRDVTKKLSFTFKKEKDGSISLTVVKPDNAGIPLLKEAPLIGKGELKRNQIKFTNINENTTIYGGRNANTFTMNRDVDFQGTLIGGEGFSGGWIPNSFWNESSSLDKAFSGTKAAGDLYKLINDAAHGKFPELTVQNTLVYTGGEVSKNFAKDFFTPDPSSLREVSRDSSHSSAYEGSNQWTLTLDPSKLTEGQKVEIGYVRELSVSTVSYSLQTVLKELTYSANANTFKTAIKTALDKTFDSSGGGVTVSVSGNTVTINNYIDNTKGKVLTFQSEERAQKLPNFSGSIKNINNVTFSHGVNVAVGDSWGANFDYSDWKDDKLGALKEGFDTGRNTFSVQGNLFKDLFGAAVPADSKAGAALSYVDGVLGAAISPFFGQNFSPSVNVLAGMSGGDTYKFSGFFGAAAILEFPDLLIGGENYIPEGFDTLDLSGIRSNMVIDVYDAAWFGSLDAQGRSDFFTAFNFSEDDVDAISGIGGNIVMVRDESLKDFIEGFGLGSYNLNNTPFADHIGNHIFAMDIENLVLGAGTATVKFHGNASFQGVITPNAKGKLNFDYADYTGATVEKDGNTYATLIDPLAGVNYELLPAVEIIPKFDVGGVTVDGLKWDGISWKYGSASGVQGHRFLGLDTWLDLAGVYDPANFAITGYSNVYDSAGDDHYTGTSKDNSFFIINGGANVVDAGSGANTTVQWPGVKDSNDESNGDILVFGDSSGVTLTLNGDGSGTGVDNADSTFEVNFSEVEVVGGGIGNDTINGSTLNDKFYFNEQNTGEGWGHDVVYGSGGTDKIVFGGKIDGDINAVDYSDEYLIAFEKNGSRFFHTLEDLISQGDFTLEHSNLTPVSTLLTSALTTVELDALKAKIVNGDINGISHSSDSISFVSAELVSNVTVYTLDLKNGQNSTIAAYDTEGWEQYSSSSVKASLFSNWAASSISAGYQAEKNSNSTFEVGGAVALDTDTVIPATVVGTTIDGSEAAITDLLTAAIAEWQQAGFDVSAATGLSVLIADLADRGLAAVSGTAITLDATAAGIGWYLDTDTSIDDVPTDQVDLYTVLLHEVGHIIGFEHGGSTGLMSGTLTPGQRYSIDAVAIRDTANLSAGLEDVKAFANKLNSFIIDEVLAINLPFASIGIADLLPSGSTSFIDGLNDSVNNFTVLIDNYLSDSGANATIDGLLSFMRANGYLVERTLGGDNQFSVSFDILSFADDAGIPLNFDGWDIPGLPFDLPISVGGDYEIPISGGISFNLEMGLDSNGDFFLADPSVDADIQLGNDSFAYNSMHVADDGGELRSYIDIEGDVSADYNSSDWLTVSGLSSGFSASQINRAVYDSDNNTTRIWLKDVLTSQLVLDALTVVIGSDSLSEGDGLMSVSNSADEVLLLLEGQFLSDDLNAAVNTGLGSIDINGQSYDVIEIRYDASSVQTTLVLAQAVVGEIDSGIAQLRKSFGGVGANGEDAPFELQLGMFGLGAGKDGFIDFSAAFSAGAEGRFNSAEISALISNYDGFHIGFDQQPDYAVYLPIEMTGVLDGISDGRAYVTAFSDPNLDGVSFTQLVYSIPQTLNFSGFDELLQLSDVSLDMILAGLESMFDDLVGINREVWVDQADNNAIYEQRYVDVTIGGEGSLAYWSMPDSPLLTTTVDDYQQSTFKSPFSVNDNGTVRSISTWENTDNGLSYLGYEDSGTLYLYEAVTAALNTSPSNTFYSLYRIKADSATQRGLNKAGQTIELFEYEFGDPLETVWGYEDTNSDGVKQLVAVESRWVNTSTYLDSQGTLTLGVDTLTGEKGEGSSTLNLLKGLLKSGSLYQNIDLIDHSIADILGDGVDFVESLGDAISDTRDFLSDDSGLSDLSDYFNQHLRTALGLDNSYNPLSFTYSNSTFEADFDLLFEDSDSIELDFSLEDLGLGSAFDSGPLAADASTTIDIDAYAEITAGFGFDLSNILDPQLFLDADTGFSAGANGSATDIEMLLGLDGGVLGDIGFMIDDGEIYLGASIDVGFEEPGEDVDGAIIYDGRIALGDVKDALVVAGLVDVQVDLPMYFPIKSMPIGGSTEDNNNDGYADNVLHFDTGATVSLDDGFDFNGINYLIPDFSMDFDGIALLYAVLNDPQMILSGLNIFFDGLDKVGDGIASIEIPLIGGDSFDKLADSVYDVRGVVMQAAFTAPNDYGSIADADGNVTLESLLQEMISRGDAVFDVLVQAMRDALYEGLKTIDDPLFSFVVPILGDNDSVQYSDDGKILTKRPQSSDDIQLTLSSNGELAFNIMFGGVLVGQKVEVKDAVTDEVTDTYIDAAGIPIDFSAGIPGLNLDVDAEIQAAIDYLMGIGLGIDGGGIFLDTSGINAEGEEISLDLSAKFTTDGRDAVNQTAFNPDSRDTTGHTPVSATLGFLTMDLWGEAGINGHLGLDIQDADGDGYWRGERLSLEVNASAEAYADLLAKAATTAGAILPSMNTFIEYDQVLGDATWNSRSGFSFETGSPEVVLHDVTLDAGSILDSFLGDSLSIIKDIIDPIKPVVDLLTMEIDLGITTVQFIDLAYLRLPAQTVDTAKKVLNVLKSTIEFIDTVEGMGGTLNFGDFYLGGTFLSDPNSTVSENDTKTATGSTKTAPTGGDQSTKTVAQGPNQSGLDGKSTSGSQAGKNSNSTSAKRFKLPILEDPASALGLITGKVVDLFWYDLPDLDLSFEYSKSYPVFTGLNAIIGGSVGVTTNFDFGFDTSGFIEFQNSGFDASQAWRIMNGFFLDDHGQENTDTDLDEVTLVAKIFAGASLGIGGLVEAGVLGGIEALIGFDLNDKLSEFIDGNPVGDAKVYGSELIERISHGPQCLFDVHGEISVFLEAFLWVGVDLGFSEITLFEARERFVDEIIAQFEWECVHTAPQYLTDYNNGTLNLNYSGNDSGGEQLFNVIGMDREDPWTIETLFNLGLIDFDTYTSSELQTLSTQLENLSNSGETNIIAVSTGQRVEVFAASQVHTLRASGTGGNDNYRLSKLDGLIKTIDFSDLGGGNDYVEVNIDGAVDLVPGDLLNITIEGGEGNDTIIINAGDRGHTVNNIVLSGSAGEDRMRVSSSIIANVMMIGGIGDDSLRMDGEDNAYESFIAFGGKANDAIMGGVNQDFIFGDDSIDSANIQDLFDLVTTGLNLGDASDRADLYDLVAQETQKLGGMDTIVSYGGADFVDSGDETVAKNAAGVISVYYRPDGTPFATSDYDSEGVLINLNQDYIIQSKHGDIIDTGDGDDVIYGGSGFDQITGGKGNNIVYAGDGDDIINALESTGQFYGEGGDDTVIWDYMPGSDIVIDGGLGDDIINTTLNDNANDVEIIANGAAAVLRVRDDKLSSTPFDEVTLNAVEALTLEMKAGDDNLLIGDLIATDLEVIDVDAGSQLETMWQADRGEGNANAVTRADNRLQYLPTIPSGATNVVIHYQDQSVTLIDTGDQRADLTAALQSLTDNADLALTQFTHEDNQRLAINLEETGLLADDNANYALFTLSYSNAAGDQLVYADTAITAQGIDARQSDYFYRTSLESGSYSFTADGQPILDDHYAASQNTNANLTQTISVADGLDGITLFYGYDENLANNGLADNNAVEVFSWMTAEQVASLINSEISNVTVTVSASDTGEAGTWVLDVTSVGAKQFAYHYQEQQYSGVAYLESNSALLQGFIRSSNEGLGDWEYNYNNDGSPQIDIETAVISGQFSWADWMASATLNSGNESIRLEAVYEAVSAAQQTAVFTGDDADWTQATSILKDLLNSIDGLGTITLTVSDQANGLPEW